MSETTATFPAAPRNLDKVYRSYRRNQCGKGCRGASAVEFAVVAPVFFLLIFGMIEYGRMVMVQQVITNASREGCRRAVIDGSTYADVQTSVTNYLTSAGIKNTTLTVTDNSNGVPGSTQTVSLSGFGTGNADPKISWTAPSAILGNISGGVAGRNTT